MSVVSPVNSLKLAEQLVDSLIGDGLDPRLKEIARFSQIRNGKRSTSVRYSLDGKVYDLTNGRWSVKVGNGWSPCEPPAKREPVPAG